MDPEAPSTTTAADAPEKGSTLTPLRQRAGLPLGMFLLLGGLTAFGSLSTDMHLPALPDIAEGLDTTPAMTQLTVSASLIGLALGQLFVGPLSDRLGRRRPLLVAVTFFVVTSLLCAASTSIWMLLGIRLAQGLAGGAGSVIARAMVRDMFSGNAMARVTSQLMLVFGLAPIVGPVLGAQVLAYGHWRSVFVALAGIGLVLLLGSLAALPETLPHERRSRDRGEQWRSMGRLAVDRRFAAHMAVAMMTGATMFTYISMSSFVLLAEFDVQPQTFSLVFATNSVGFVLGGQLNARLVMRLGAATMLRAAQTGVVVAALGLVVAGLLDAPLPVVLTCLWFLQFSTGGINGNNTALALEANAHQAGAASALLGMCAFIAGAALPPLVSTLGTGVTTLGTSLLCTSALGALAFRLGWHPRGTTPHV